jgi:hypothetical protein
MVAWALYATPGSSDVSMRRSYVPLSESTAVMVVELPVTELLVTAISRYTGVGDCVGGVLGRVVGSWAKGGGIVRGSTGVGVMACWEDDTGIL